MNDHLKKQAKNLQRLLPDFLRENAATGLTLAACQELIARCHGYPNWHATATIRPLESAQEKTWKDIPPEYWDLPELHLIAYGWPSGGLQKFCEVADLEPRVMRNHLSRNYALSETDLERVRSLAGITVEVDGEVGPRVYRDGAAVFEADLPRPEAEDLYDLLIDLRGDGEFACEVLPPRGRGDKDFRYVVTTRFCAEPDILVFHRSWTSTELLDARHKAHGSSQIHEPFELLHFVGPVRVNRPLFDNIVQCHRDARARPAQAASAAKSIVSAWEAFVNNIKQHLGDMMLSSVDGTHAICDLASEGKLLKLSELDDPGDPDLGMLRELEHLAGRRT